MIHILDEIKTFIKSEIVLSVSLILAAISLFLVHPDAKYMEYIDYRTLAILFGLMVIMVGLQRLRVFRQVGEMLIKRAGSARAIAVILMLLCFFFSMLITNDVALLTFVPFTVVVLHLAKANKLLIPVIVIETIAANLGSMMTPMGNPQNLYLYSMSGMSIGQFLFLMLPYAAISLAALLVLCRYLVPVREMKVEGAGEYSRSRKEKIRLGVYVILFVLSLLVVARVLDYRLGFVAVVLVVFLMDRKSLVRTDYSLLFTFICLFVFIGNMKRIPAVSDMLSGLVLGHETGVAVLASQLISNVPAAILLSGFTENIRSLIVGTNLGGLGTLIASMASLISFKQYSRVQGSDTKQYLLSFTLWNAVLLVILLIATLIFPS